MKFHFLPSPKPKQISSEAWSSWVWQTQNSLTTIADFSQYFSLTENEKQAFVSGEKLFQFRTTPYYASLAFDDVSDPLRRIVVPRFFEIEKGTQVQLDPLGERKNNPAPRIVHRYSDRVLFLITDICNAYCRYCTRKHFTGQEQALVHGQDYEDALRYIADHSGIREVILSGGDPLTLGDSVLFRILEDLRKIEHLEIIRIGSRMPVVNPMRITSDLVKGLKRFQPVYLMTHFNHPRELTLEAKQAIELIVDSGIPTFNQMVLLNGVNNHPAIVQALSRRLLFLRVKPYYMFQCDPSFGTDHLRTSIEESEQIQRELWGHLSGLAMPNLSLDIPDGGGKVGLVPQFEVARDNFGRIYRGWDGVEHSYLNPRYVHRELPADLDIYLREWDELKSAKQGQHRSQDISCFT